METQADKDLSWATKVAEILTDGQRDEEHTKLDFWFRLDIHLQNTGNFDGVSMAQKSIDEERRRGWSTD